METPEQLAAIEKIKQQAAAHPLKPLLVSEHTSPAQGNFQETRHLRYAVTKDGRKMENIYNVTLDGKITVAQV